MNKEIEYFLDFKDEDIEESDTLNLLKSKSPPPTPKQKIFVIAFVVLIFILTTVFGYLSMYGNKSKAETTVNQSIETSASDKENISEKYKIKALSINENDSSLLRGRLNITKDDLSSLNDNDIVELFNYISSLENFRWTTICFSDGTGIFSLPGNKNVYLYGSIDETGLIKETYGYIINNNDYIFISTIDTTANVSTEMIEVENTSDSDIETVYITASGTKYHIGSCSYLTNSKTTISLSKAKEQGYLPCSRCIK